MDSFAAGTKPALVIDNGTGSVACVCACGLGQRLCVCMCAPGRYGAAGAIGGAAGGFIVVGLMPLGMVGLAVVLVRRKGRGREREAEGRHFGADGLLVGVVASVVGWSRGRGHGKSA